MWFLAVLCVAVTALPISPVSDSAIDQFVDSEMPVAAVPGLSYVAVSGDEITTVDARGVMKRGSDKDVTMRTPFVAGSISKSFTALAIMQLVERGEIDLDSELGLYVEGFAGEAAGGITIRQLLGHTSGFSTLQGNTTHGDSIGGNDALARSVESLTEVVPAYGPDEVWEYSNTNYQILGRVVEVVSGQEYQTYVETNIMEPVGMDDSFVSDGEVHRDIATGHTPWFGSKRALATNSTSRVTAPQGGVIASAEDLALYMQTIMNEEDDVLSPAGKAQMLSPASELSPFYGFGWFLDPDRGIAWHDGTSPGVETLATMIPDEQKAVVVLVNGGSGMGFGETWTLRNGVTERVLGLEITESGPRWSRQILFVSLSLLPIFYVVSIGWAWRRRSIIRAKTGAAGIFSLWFPVLTTTVAAWIMISLIPDMFGVSLSAFRRFQPDLVLVLIAAAVLGMVWAAFRLVVAYTGDLGPDR